jgi:hypothetical protein
VGAVQVKVAELEAPAVGAVVFCETVVFAVAVHPLAAVTTTEYMPGIFTTGFAVDAPLIIPGPVHTYEPPPLPVRVADVIAQVNPEELEAPATGAVLFSIMVVLAVAVHPLAAVTKTV